MAIKIIVTGGTFDKEYNPLNGQLFFKEHMSQRCLNWDDHGYRSI